MKPLFIAALVCWSLTGVRAQEPPRRQTIRQREAAGSVRDHVAIDQITAYNLIERSARIRYMAGQAVTLQPGFSAQAGSVFSATVEPVFVVNAATKPEVVFSVRAYPNPFQQTTTIDYVLPQAGQVSLRLVDEQGHVLQQDTSQREAGRQELSLTGANLTAGIYFYQILFNGQQRVVRLVKSP